MPTPPMPELSRYTPSRMMSGPLLAERGEPLQLDGLRIDPCVPHGCRDYTVTRLYRGAKYVIHVTNPEGVQHGIKELRLEGKTLKSSLIPVQAPGAEAHIEVIMG